MLKDCLSKASSRTLNILQRLLGRYGLGFLRLAGQLCLLLQHLLDCRTCVQRCALVLLLEWALEVTFVIKRSFSTWSQDSLWRLIGTLMIYYEWNSRSQFRFGVFMKAFVLNVLCIFWAWVKLHLRLTVC